MFLWFFGLVGELDHFFFSKTIIMPMMLVAEIENKIMIGSPLCSLKIMIIDCNLLNGPKAQ